MHEISRENICEELETKKSFIEDHKKQFIGAKGRIPEDIFDVTVFFFDEVIDAHESLSILMQANHFQGCPPIARIILENSINIQYIYKQEAEKRAKNHKLNSISLFLKRYSEMEKKPTGYTEIEKILKEQLSNYIPDKKTLKEKANDVQLLALYINYKRLSGYIHPEYKANRDLTADRPYINYLKTVVFFDIFIVVLESLKKICEKYDLDGGIMAINNPLYPYDVFFSTNTKI